MSKATEINCSTVNQAIEAHCAILREMAKNGIKDFEISITAHGTWQITNGNLVTIEEGEEVPVFAFVEVENYDPLDNLYSAEEPDGYITTFDENGLTYLYPTIMSQIVVKG